MERPAPPSGALSGARLAAGLGLVTGAGEVAADALIGGLGGGVGELVLLGAVDALLLAGAAALAALLLAPVVGRAGDARGLALRVGVVAGLLAALFALPVAVALLGEGATLGLFFAVLPLVVGVAVLGQARFWLARGSADGGGRVGRWAALGGAAVLVGAGAGLGSRPSVGAAEGVDLVLVTVDGLRSTDLASPGLAALAATSTVYTDLVVPSPSTVASHAALLTALHPLRSRALDDLHALPAGILTVPERLRDAGLRTGAFLATAAVIDVGLDQGFGRVDDGFGPLGLTRLALIDAVVGGGLVRRDPADVVARALAWRATGRGRALLWVQLDATFGVAPVEAALARLVDGCDDARVIVVAATGARPGPSATSLADDVVRVPLLVRGPGGAPVGTVDGPRRAVDVGVTLLEAGGVPRTDELDGVPIDVDAREPAAATALLVARTEDGRHVLGLRQDGVKGLLDPDADRVEVYDLAADPHESRDLAAEQAATASSVRAALEPDVALLRRVAAEPELGARRRARLVALGWHP